MSSRWKPYAWALLLTFAAGCGGPAKHIPNEEEKVRELISHVADGASSQKSMATLFAADAAPAETERPRYSKYSYRAGVPKITGDSATTVVEFLSPFTDKPVGQAEWSCVRDGERWKLKSAPLPADLPIPKAS